MDPSAEKKNLKKGKTVLKFSGNMLNEDELIPREIFPTTQTPMFDKKRNTAMGYNDEKVDLFDDGHYL